MRWSLLLALALLLVSPVAADDYDDEDYAPPKDESKASIETGYQGSDVEDSAVRAAEYVDTEPNAAFGLHWSTSPFDDSGFKLDFERWNASEVGGEVTMDLERMVRFKASADYLVHRLDHDSISNLQGVSDIKVVRATDLDQDAEYQIRHKLYEIEADFHPPRMDWFSIHAGFRQQMREGRKQSLHTGHCTSCHTVSQSRIIDQETTDGVVGLQFKSSLFQLAYEVLSRTFGEKGGQPVAPFETPYRPAPPPWSGNQEDLPLPFNDRLYFPIPGTAPDSATAAYDQVPDIKRTAHVLKLKTGDNDRNTVNFTLLKSNTENRYTNLEYDFEGFRGLYTLRLRDNLRINFSAQRDKIENDPVEVNPAALWGSGPFARNYGGEILTFEQWRQAVDDPLLNFTDFMRNSSMNRTDDRIGIDTFWRPMRHGTFRAKYTYRKIDRDNVVLIDGTGETTSHALKLGWNQRFGKRLRWNNSLLFKTIDNPYASVGGALREFAGYSEPGIVLGQVPTNPSPTSPLSLQYYQLHALRVANISNVPTQYIKLRTSANWSPKGTWALSGNLRYKDAENDELNYSTWDQNTLGVGVNFWVAVKPELHFTIGADHFQEETEAFTTIPLMDG
jgi:hypothetical protein